MTDAARISTVLLCHAEEPLHTDAAARWLHASTDLLGIIRIHDSRRTLWKRVKREWKRSGTLGMLDVLAYRIYYRLFVSSGDDQWAERRLTELRARWPAVPPDIPVLDVANPASRECEEFLKAHRPDAMVALCKHILPPRIFEIPRAGTFILHDGIAPEYRNAHGCFWAMAKGEFDKVGLTVLRADRGVDTGPIFGHFSYPYDARRETHVVIANRVLLDNLDAVAELIGRAVRGEAEPVSVEGRASGVWGQPHLTDYLALQRKLRRSDAGGRTGVS